VGDYVKELIMGMPRTDLPHVSKLDPDLAHEIVTAMANAYDKAEKTSTGISYVATWVEMLEAALEVFSSQTLKHPYEVEE
jgi:hypothetical protein